jgi:hypothetical protein
MTRIKKVKYNDRTLRTEITIKVETEPMHFTRDEVESMLHDLCDQTMRMLNGTRYLNAPLSDIVVQ